MENGKIRVEFLTDIVKEAEVKMEQMEVEDEIPSIGLPQFFVKMEGYREAIQRPYLFKEGKPLTIDQEVFRQQPPYAPTKVFPA